MKKNKILLSMFLTSVNAFGQVGINTPNPHLKVTLELVPTTKAVLIIPYIDGNKGV